MTNVVYDMYIEAPSRQNVNSSRRYYDGKFSGRRWGWNQATGGYKPGSEIYQEPRVGEEITFSWADNNAIDYRFRPNPRMESKVLSQVFE